MTQLCSPIDRNRPRIIALTGATGYVGGRLAPELLARGFIVRCLARSAAKVAARSWSSHPRVQIVEADFGDSAQLAAALSGCDAAYYLIHSMISIGRGYADEDLRLATAFAQAARSADLKQVIYLGGLGDDRDDLSAHLASRREVETALKSTGVPVTVLRAAMIIGSGSASFEILRYLVERLPIMVTPRWVRTEVQPIAIRNVVHYLADVATAPGVIGRTLDLGGPQIVTYNDLMRMMAESLHVRRRLVIPVGVLTPRLSSLWIHLVTPLSSRIARPLAEGLRNRVVCRNDEAQHLMPQSLLTPRAAIEAAIHRTQSGQISTSWSDAGPIPGDPDWAGGTTFVDQRSTCIDATPEAVFNSVCRVGGGHGYYAADWLWRVRGALDRMIGGPGLRRGRRDPTRVSFGDALDFWRVTGITPNRSLELRAEMKLPGMATLSFDMNPMPDGTTRLTQTARFRPRGLAGLLYWYAVLPLHGFVFHGLLHGIRRVSLEQSDHMPTTSGALGTSPRLSDQSPLTSDGANTLPRPAPLRTNRKH